MPRIAKNVPTRRLNLEMSEAVREALENLRDTTDADSLTEVIRRSLAVYDFLWAEKKQGGKITVKGPAGEKEIVLL
ncbi:MAG: ribbon-helix-helix protein, CopG family [Planctomycetes bacterium]|nr:ribbon-helix-helix protein, CopG family [Planctomycetota bacterium]